MSYRVLAASFLVSLSFASLATAGPYSSISGVTPGAPDNPIARTSLSLFESQIIDYSPAPGVGANFRSPSTGIASLGDLYSPVTRPDGPNTSFDKRYHPEPGTEPNNFHNGSASNSPFGGNLNDPNDTYGFLGIDAPGSITVGFGLHKIINGPGPDFAVFENGFAFGGAGSLFAELAYVEVSSNGSDFARFPSISLNTTHTAVSGTFQGYDMTNVYNLAGKHASNWGTPFDLDELTSDPLVTNGLLDLSRVRYVRLVDVVGSGTILDNSGNPIPGIARDSLGNPILDNYVTFDSGGFDYLGLSTGAVGVANYVVPEPSTVVLGGLGSLLVAGIQWRRRRRR
ncbi:MAG: PEP-CTERM sorting domain-containing protein [Pirellulales bacterium]|nr:PEP-CTERM sorting domain-containing protein [Pirellulales bacterium]